MKRARYPYREEKQQFFNHTGKVLIFSRQLEVVPFRPTCNGRRSRKWKVDNNGIEGRKEMRMSPKEKQCLQCDRTEHAVPLFALQYRGGTVWICPQCLPMLIHSPHKLAGKLPGAESMDASEHTH
jgi:hypothetical protein